MGSGGWGWGVWVHNPDPPCVPRYGFKFDLNFPYLVTVVVLVLDAPPTTRSSAEATPAASTDPSRETEEEAWL